MSNQDQYNAKNAELIATFEELIRRANNEINVIVGKALGEMAFAANLQNAPMGNLTQVLKRLGIEKLAGLGTVGPNSRDLLLNGAHGLGRTQQPNWPPTNLDDDPSDVVSGMYRISSSSPGPGLGNVLWLKYNSNAGSLVWFGVSNSVFRIKGRSFGQNGWGDWVTVYDTGNATRDSNGVLRAASPIFRVATAAECAQGDGFTDAGAGMANAEAQGVTSERRDTGVYSITGSLGFATDNVWPNGFVIPQDANGNNLVFAEAEQDDDGTITLRTYEPKFEWQSGRHVAGDPLDIPQGRWVDMRLSMPKTEIEGGVTALVQRVKHLADYFHRAGHRWRRERDLLIASLTPSINRFAGCPQ